MKIVDIRKNENIPTHYKDRYSESKVWLDMANAVLHEFSVKEFFKDTAVLSYDNGRRGYVLPTDFSSMVFVGVLPVVGLDFKSAPTTPIEHFTLEDGVIRLLPRLDNVYRRLLNSEHFEDNEKPKYNDIWIMYYPIRKCEDLAKTSTPTTAENEFDEYFVPLLPIMETAFISGIIWACARREDDTGALPYVRELRNGFERDMMEIQNRIKKPQAGQARFNRISYRNPFF
jgi:hypothetical protein